MRVKQELKNVLFGGTTTSQWSAVAVEDPAAEVTVTLRCGRREWDVGENCVVISLRPFAAGVGCSSEELDALSSSQCQLLLHERSPARRLLAEIELTHTGQVALDGEFLAMFAAQGCHMYCIAPAQQWMRSLLGSYREWQGRKTAAAYNFAVQGLDRDSLFAFYVRPRPVVLVSVAHGDASNLFPMDLVGRINQRYFTLALRSTSPAVELMRESRRVAIGAVPARFVGVAYELGKHHRLRSIDWAALPFSLLRSPRYGLALPSFSLRIQELDVEAVQECGSHTLFVTRPAEERVLARGPQLCHVPGVYQAYRERQGSPLRPAAGA